MSLRELDKKLQPSKDKLDDYRAMLSPWVNFKPSGELDKLQRLAAEARPVVQEILKLVAQAAKDYPAANNGQRPVYLRKLIIQLHRDFIDGFKNTYLNLPDKCLMTREKILSRKLDDFRHYSPTIIGKIDLSSAGGCAGELQFLKTAFRENLKALTNEIDDFVSRMLETKSAPPVREVFMSKEVEAQVDRETARRKVDTPPTPWDVREVLIQRKD